MFRLGQCHLLGTGVQHDVSKAADLLLRATNLNHADAAVWLAHMTFQALIPATHRDRREYMKDSLFKQTKCVSTTAMFNRGWCWLEGVGVPKDRASAQCFEAAARAGCTPAMLELAMILDEDGADVDAYKWRQLAADRGTLGGMFQVGEALLNGYGADCDPDAAFGWFSKAAAAGWSEGIGLVGRCYLEGRGVRQDLLAGMALVRQAANAEPYSSEACWLLFEAYRDGCGEKQSDKDAEKWLVKAANANLEDARVEARKRKLPFDDD
jgi:TPR repeat protein